MFKIVVLIPVTTITILNSRFQGEGGGGGGGGTDSSGPTIAILMK